MQRILLKLSGEAFAEPGTRAGVDPEISRSVAAEIAAVGETRALDDIDRFDFYDLAKGAYAVIQTGERRFYGCFMLRKGVIPPED